MSKLISSPVECGHRISLFTGNNCRHPEGKLITCRYESFPFACPLPDGITIKQCNESPSEMVDRLLKPKRRNRKDCVSFETQPVKERECFHYRVKGWACKGVNCGHFEPKKE